MDTESQQCGEGVSSLGEAPIPSDQELIQRFQMHPSDLRTNYSRFHKEGGIDAQDGLE
jgi:hypothetical protein